MKKGVLIGCFALLILVGIFAISFSSAALVVVSPVNGTNYSTSLLFNISYTNVTDGITSPINASFFYNLTGAWTSIGNVSTCSSNACWGTINIAGLIDGTYSINASLANGSQQNSSLGLAFKVGFDSHSPMLVAANVSAPLAYTNYTGNLFLNVSVADNFTGVNTVLFNITNATSGAQVALAVASNPAGKSYNATFDTTTIANGVYTIIVQANDTLNNLNNSVSLSTIALDNSAPVVTFTCDSNYQLTQGQTLTCSCSAVDPDSGLNGTVSYTAHPSTTTVGQFNTTCTIGNMVGLGSNYNRTYTILTIDNTGSSGSSGGGGSTPSTPATKTSSAWNSLSAGASVTKNDFTTDYGLKQITFSISQASTNSKVTVSKYDSVPAEVGVANSAPNGVYKYLQIHVDNISVSNADIVIQVDKTWAMSHNTYQNISMYKFVNGAWQELKTTYRGDDTNNYYFDVNINSFSYFSIAGKSVPGTTTPSTTDNTGGSTTTPSTPAATGSSTTLWISLGIIVVIIVVIIIIFFSLKKSNKKFK